MVTMKLLDMGSPIETAVSTSLALVFSAGVSILGCMTVGAVELIELPPLVVGR